MILVDTSVLYACFDADDARHPLATDTFARLASTDDLVTHDYVVSETAALIQRRLGPAALRSLFDEVMPAISTLYVDQTIHEAAISALLASQSKSVSLVDWTSFEIMRRWSIDRAFAFDDDFAAQGFTLVPTAPGTG